MKHDNPKLIDALAAEYVLGTLGGRARRRFERWRTQEWHVERRVQAWEERLSGLALRLPPMRPSPNVWNKIEKRIGATASAGSRTQSPPQRQRVPWQTVAAGIGILAVLVASFFTWRATSRPDLNPIAVVQAERATTPAWQLEADDDFRYLRAVAGGGAELQPGKSYELWALPDSGAAPVSLGVIPASGEIQRELTEAQRAALRGASKVAVSLEPEGGSTTGGPTGPVLFVADRIKRA